MFDELIRNLKNLEKAHNFYVGANEADRERIYNACDRAGGLFDGISHCYVFRNSYNGSASPTSDRGYGSSPSLDRSFGTLFLLYGIEFLKSEYKVDSLEEFVALLHNGKVLY